VNRRTMIASVLSAGVMGSVFGVSKLFKKDDLIYCKMEDLWKIVKFIPENRNVYKVENYPVCSVFKRIKFHELKPRDFFVLVSDENEYKTYKGYVLQAKSYPTPCEGGIDNHVVDTAIVSIA
jgi:hypothetical protein